MPLRPDDEEPGGDELPGAELDRGLRAAFGSGTAPTGAKGDDQPTLPGVRAGGVTESIRALHGVAAAAEPGDEAEVAPRDAAPLHTSRYEVRGEIARGGMGAIYDVRDRDLRRSLAMKVLHGRAAGGRTPGTPIPAEILNRFLEEARVTAQLAHPGVVPVHELGVDAQGRVFFTMQLVRGKTLSAIIQLARRREDGWTRTRALQVIQRVCETLAFAHDKGVIHRDIKPDNVMVGRFGETYVMDWGLAKVLDREDPHDLRLRESGGGPPSAVETQSCDGGGDSPVMTMDGVVIGTPAYMPPEQARGAVADVDERADVYAAGALMYELLTGRAPYVEPGARVSPRVVLGAVHMGPPTPVREIEPDLPDEVVAICEKAMARRREDRYATAKDLADDIQAFVEGRVVQAYRTGPLVEAHKWIGRNRALAASIAAGLLVAVGGSIAFAVHANRAARSERAERVRAEGLRLSARAGNEGEENPGLALGLAIEGAVRADDPYGRSALYRALGNLNEVATLERHPGYVDAVGIDAAGRRLLSVSTHGGRRRGELVLWDLDSRRPLSFREVHDGPIARIEFAWTGDRVATAGVDDGTVRIWDVSDGALAGTVEPGADVAAMSWDGEGRRLAVVTGTGRLAIWGATGGEPVLDAALESGRALAVALRQDAAKVAVALADGSVSVRDAGTGAEEARLPAHAADGPVRHGRVLWLDGGRLLLVFRDDPATTKVPGLPFLGWTEVWDVAAGRRVAEFGGAEERTSSPVCDASGGTLALILTDRAARRRSIVAWDAATRRQRWRTDGVPEYELFGLSPNGRHLVGSKVEGDVPAFSMGLWDARTGRLEARLRGHTYGETDAAVTDAGLVATSSGDTTVRLWRASSPLTLAGTSEWDLGDANVVAFLAGHRRALVRDAAGRIECRAVPDGRTVYALPAGASEASVRIDRARNRIALPDPETGQVHLLDALDGHALPGLPAPAAWERGAPVQLQFAPDGSRLLRWTQGRVEVLDPDGGEEVSAWETDLEPGAVPVVWCPEGRSILVSTGAARRILELDVATGGLIRSFEGVHTGLPTGVAVSPSGAVVATCAADTSVLLWDRGTAAVLGRVQGLFMGDLIASFDPTERFLVVRDPVDTVTIVDVARREVFAEVELRGWGVTTFDAGDLLAAGTGTVLRVSLDPVAAARRAQPRPLFPIEIAKFDVGDGAERAALVDEYVAWTWSPRRILYLGLAAAASGDFARARRYLARIEEIDPAATERLVVRAALEAAAGDESAALRTLGAAVDAGCGERPLRHAAFDALRRSPGWDALTAPAVRR